MDSGRINFQGQHSAHENVGSIGLRHMICCVGAQNEPLHGNILMALSAVVLARWASRGAFCMGPIVWQIRGPSYVVNGSANSVALMVNHLLTLFNE